MSATDKYDIFLSYSLKDQDWVSEFAAALKEAGLRPWFDASQIRPGERWKEKIQDALRESRTLVVVLTPNNIDDPSIFFEVGAAVADNKRIIPVLTEDLDFAKVPSLLLRLQPLRESSPREAARKVVEVLQESVET